MSKQNTRIFYGFTLIEILITVAIISLLSSVAFYNYTEAKVRANDAHKQVEVYEVAKAIEIKRLSGEPPKNYVGNALGKRTAPAQEGTPEYDKSMQELVDAKLLPAIPRSPDGKSYFYFYDEVTGSAIFGATLNSKKSSNACVSSSGHSCNTDGDGNITIPTVTDREPEEEQNIFASCGSAQNAQEYNANTAPKSTDLCSIGTSNKLIYDSNPEQNRWEWQCESGNNTIYCNTFTTIAVVDNYVATCGSANAGSYTSTTFNELSNTDLCLHGEATAPYSDGNGKIIWYCDYPSTTAYETSTGCQADYTEDVIVPPPVAGQCGFDSGASFDAEDPPTLLCYEGIPTTVTRQDNYFVWDCIGEPSVSCSSYVRVYETASCGSANGHYYWEGTTPSEYELCNIGTSNNFEFIQEDGSYDSYSGTYREGSWNWSCDYQNIWGQWSNVSCNAIDGYVSSRCGPASNNFYDDISQISPNDMCYPSSGGNNIEYYPNENTWIWICSGGYFPIYCTAYKN